MGSDVPPAEASEQSTTVPMPVYWEGLDAKAREAVLQRPGSSLVSSETIVPILQDVQSRGDAALMAYTERFDGVRLSSLQVSDDEWAAAESVSEPFKRAVQKAHANIHRFHVAQKPADVDLESQPGIRCQLLHRPFATVGLYVPGGTAPLPSAIMMLGIPATIAGCRQRYFCTPPNKDGHIDPHILYAAKASGITQGFKVGGSQAIAAMAYGTQSIPRAAKIFGPGNAYVTAAKMMVSQDPKGAAIDMPAGPSEVMVIADDTASPMIVASDLLSQAEHGTNSQVLLVCASQAFADQTRVALIQQCSQLSRHQIGFAALQHARFIIVDTAFQETATAIAEYYAPEHLILQVQKARDWVQHIDHAGSVFIGALASESFGDYASGTNHVLPTNGFARSYSGVSLRAFYRTMTTQEVSREALADLGPHVITLAEAEGLDGHANAVRLRMAQPS